MEIGLETGHVGCLHDDSNKLFYTNLLRACVQLTIGVVDGRRLVVMTEDDGRDLDSTVGHILMSLSVVLPGVAVE